jgi:Ca-activated chloride channel homolog
MKIIFALLFLVLLTLPGDSRAQTTVADKTPRGKKTLVSVPVSVSDREGRYISGLKKDDFKIYQNGVEQDIDFFATEEEPVSVALLIDTSGSTKEVLDKIRNAAEDFIELMNPNDQTMIATFDADIRILSPFSSDRKALKQSLGKIRTAEKEGSVVLRAVQEISQKSFDKIQGRKVVVLLSDGKDFGSTVTKSELLSGLEESDVLIYSVFYQTGKGFNKLVVDSGGEAKEAKPAAKPKKPKKVKKPKGYSIMIPLPGDTLTEEDIKLTDKVASIDAVNVLQEMSDATAGRFYTASAPDLSRIFKQIAAELRQQYRLGYYTRDAASADVYNISVKVGRADAVVRARGRFRAKQLQ